MNPTGIKFTSTWIQPCESCRAKGFMPFGKSTVWLPPGKEEITREEFRRALFGENFPDIAKRVHDIDDARVLADHEQAQRDRRPKLVKT